MLPFLGMLQLTVRELRAKKVIWGLFLISSLVLLIVTFALNLDVVDGTLASARIFGAEATGGIDLENLVFAVQSIVAGAAYWLGILLALFASGPIFTTLLTKGHIDLLLSKPISRTRLLTGHVGGVWLTMLGLCVYLLGGIWLIMSLKAEVWNARFLLSIPIVLSMFGVMYGVIVAIGSFTRSTALSLIVTYGLIVASLGLAAVTQITEQLGFVSKAVFLTLYHTLPNFTEVTTIVSKLSQGEPVSDWYPFLSSILFGAACYLIGGIKFYRRDF
ncbi:MAG: hypothetical protein GVY25_15075 [Bacteroidetes bacterium]|nr:hypothetical protein [Bacteroidota bacterium]